MANRKLQGEIDRTLKKVGEGIVEFDGIFQKISSAPSQNQKEKHENDLKREIKKLQRLREQIKAWIGQNDVKNKQPLIEARQRIEKEMERYKAYERESKTKEFSNEGLRLKMKQARIGNTKRTQFITFLEETVALLKEQSTKLEKSIKSLEAKETDDPDELEEDALKIAELDEKIERHALHIENGEKLLIKFRAKKLSNESVLPVQENLENYLSGDKDSIDRIHDSLVQLYDTLDLDNLSGENVEGDEGEGDDGDEGDLDDGDDGGDESDYDEEEEDDGAAEAAKAAKAAKDAKDAKDAKEAKDREAKEAKEREAKEKEAREKEAKEREAKAAQVVVAVRAQATQAAAAPAPTAVAPPSPAKSTTANSNKLPEPVKSTPVASPAPSIATSDPKNAPLPPGQRAAARQTEVAPQPQPTPAVKSNKKTKGTPLPLGPQPGEESDFPRLGTQPAAPAPTVVPEDSTLAAASGLFAGPTPSSKPTSAPASLTKSQTLVAPTASTPAPAPVASPATVPTPAQRAAMAQASSVPPTPSPSPAVSQSLTNSVQLTPPTSSSSSPSVSGSVSPPTPTVSFDQMLMRSWRCLPDSSSALGQPAPVSPSGESLLPLVEYTPRNPVQVHPSFPQSMAPNFDDASMFEKFDTDTLFFIFYYQQGTYQQYLAAKELKRQSWRYHKKYLTWFQRHEEPKEITPEYEQGTYVYFDYETGWCQRKKTEFTFEYRYLEDM